MHPSTRRRDRRVGTAPAGAVPALPGTFGPAGVSARGFDLLAGLREHVPAGAEVMRALTVGLARLLVQNEQVERMARKGHLLGSVCTPGRPNKLLVHAR